MGFGAEQLRDKALAAIEEAAEQCQKHPIERSKALAFALAYLWAYSSGDRDPFVWFWKSLARPNEIGRTQNVNASLNAIYRALRLQRR
jgi:hypothetical protein